MRAAAFVFVLVLFSLAACAKDSALPVTDGMGPNPTLPAPAHSLIPTVKIASAVGWPKDGKPVPAPGLKVDAFATGLNHPRWLYVLPNGDVLVAETDAPEKPDDYKGV